MASITTLQIQLDWYRHGDAVRQFKLAYEQYPLSTNHWLQYQRRHARTVEMEHLVSTQSMKQVGVVRCLRFWKTRNEPRTCHVLFSSCHWPIFGDRYTCAVLHSSIHDLGCGTCSDVQISLRTSRVSPVKPFIFVVHYSHAAVRRQVFEPRASAPLLRPFQTLDSSKRPCHPPKCHHDQHTTCHFSPNMRSEYIPS